MTDNGTSNIVKAVFRPRILAFLAVIAALVTLVLIVTSGDDGDQGDAGGEDGSGASSDGDVPGGEGDGGSGDSGDGFGGNGDGSGGGDGGDGTGGSGSGGGDGGDGTDGSGSGGGDGGDGGDGTDGSGSSGDGGGDETDPTDPAAPGLPSPSLCGSQEWFGNLPDFVQMVGDPELLPSSLRNNLFGDNTKYQNPENISGQLLAPLTIINGFNTAYAPLADIAQGQCPRISGALHISMIDGWRYDFQAVGEYVALRSDDGSVEVQIRTIPYLGTSDRVAGVGGVALTVDGRTLVIDSTAEDLVTLDGEPLAAQVAIQTDNNAYILRDENEVAIYWPDGSTTVTVTRINTQLMSVYFTLSADLTNAVGGLMGNADGDRLNDPSLPDGTAVANDFEAINRDLRDAWRLSNDESLFDGPSQFRPDLPVEPVRLSTTDALRAREVCVAAGVVVGDLLEECTFDVAVTGDDSIADIQIEGQTDRSLVAYGECPGPAAGATGDNPGRTWEVDPIMITGERAWSYAGEDGDDPLVRGVVPTSDGTAFVSDVRSGIRLIDGNGEILWSAEATPARDVVPLIAGEMAFVATTDGLLAVGLDGQPCWQLVSYGGEQFVSLGFADGKLIATTTSSQVSLVLAIDPATGEVLWQNASEVQIATVSLDTAVATADDLIIVEGERGVVLALDAASGDTMWTYEPDRSDTVSGISVLDGVAYVTARGSGLTALDVQTGVPRWTVAAPGGGVTLRVAVGSGVAVMVDESIVRGIDLASGSVRWTLGENDAFRGTQPIIAGDLVYLNVRPRQLVALDVADGSEALRVDEAFESNSQNANADFLGAPVQFGDLILVIDKAGDLVAYR